MDVLKQYKVVKRQAIMPSPKRNLTPTRRSSRIRQGLIEKMSKNDNLDRRHYEMIRNMLKGILSGLMVIIETSEMQTPHILQRPKILEALAMHRKDQNESLPSKTPIEGLDMNQPSTSRDMTVQSTSRIKPSDQLLQLTGNSLDAKPIGFVMEKETEPGTSAVGENKDDKEIVPESMEEIIEPLDLSLPSYSQDTSTQPIDYSLTKKSANDFQMEYYIQMKDCESATLQFEPNSGAGTRQKSYYYSGNEPYFVVPNLLYPYLTNEPFAPFTENTFSQTLIPDNNPTFRVCPEYILQPLDLSIANNLSSSAHSAADNFADMMPINYCLRDAEKGAVNQSDPVSHRDLNQS